MKRYVCLALILTALWAWPGRVFPAEGYNAYLLNTSLFAGRYLTFEDARTMPQFDWALGALLGYANAPVEVRTGNDRSTGVLDNLLTLDLNGGYSVHELVNVGAQLPLHLYNRGRTFDDVGDATGAGARENATSLGDMRLAAKVRVFEEGIWPFGLAITPFITLPTGDASRMLGEGRVTAGLTGSYEIDLAWLRMALNGGWHYRGGGEALGTKVRNGFPLAIGFSRDIDDQINLSLELHGEAYESANNRRFAGNPFELNLVGRYKLTRDIVLIAGGGPGVTSGVGSPDFRLFAGANYRPVKLAVPPPSTGDLRVMVQDQAGQPLEAEIGLEGPELRVGSTANGVFALNNLSPGTYHVRASRPDYETGMAQVVVTPGKIAGITVVLYQPPTELTIIVLDKDNGQHLDSEIVINPGQADENIIPNPGGEYSIETEPGKVTFTAAAEGYEAVMTTAQAEPHKNVTVTVMLRKKIEQTGRIFFAYDSAELRPESNPALDNVVAKIKMLKPARLIIEGHCSGEGTEEYNLDLSRKRAETVREYLIGKGVSQNILEVQAFGKSRPIATNDTEEGRERNRRVEFIIEEH